MKTIKGRKLKSKKNNIGNRKAINFLKFIGVTVVAVAAAVALFLTS